jgi:NAD(P)-dependent dehydrogenase (short-subunit alcohol dehydrogenase family)
MLMLTANQKLVFVAGANSRTAPEGIARTIAVRAAATGRKIALCDFSGSSADQNAEGQDTMIVDMPFTVAAADVHLMAHSPTVSGSNFYLSSNLKQRMNALFENYDQVILCGGDVDPSAALLGIKEFDPCVVLLARTKHTKKSDIRKIQSIQPIEVLLYE